MFHVLFYCLEIDTFHIKKIYSTQCKTGGRIHCNDRTVCAIHQWSVQMADCLHHFAFVHSLQAYTRLCIMISHTDKSSSVNGGVFCFLSLFLIFYLSAVCR